MASNHFNYLVTCNMKVEGRRFDIDVPDGWYVAHGDEADGRPFAVASLQPQEGEDVTFPTDSGVSVLYCTLPDIDLDNEESMWSRVKICGVRDFIYLIHMKLNYPDPESFEGMMGSKYLSEEIIEANGVSCEVLKVKQLFDGISAEYHIKPLVLDNYDYLRCIARDFDGVDEEAFHKLACDIAASVTQHTTVVPKCEEQLDRALREKISVSDFDEMTNNFAVPYEYGPGFMVKPFVYKTKILTPELDIKDVYFKLYSARTEFANRHYVHWMRLLDAVEAQLAHGTATADVAAMLKVLWDKEKELIPSLGLNMESDWGLVKMKGLLDPPQERLAFE